MFNVSSSLEVGNWTGLVQNQFLDWTIRTDLWSSSTLSTCPETLNTLVLFRSQHWSHLQWRSADPAARRMLLGCQSRLRTVERMGFLMCLLSHLTVNTTLRVTACAARSESERQVHTAVSLLTSRSPSQSSRRRWVELRCPEQTCSPEETTSHTWLHGWCAPAPAWVSTLRPSESTRKRFGQRNRSRCGWTLGPSQYLRKWINKYI